MREITAVFYWGQLSYELTQYLTNETLLTLPALWVCFEMWKSYFLWVNPEILLVNGPVKRPQW